MKSGILEIADIIVLNKADRPDADKLFNEIRVAVDTSHMVLLGIGQNIKWKPQIIKTIAKEGKGIDELIEKIEEHKKFLKENNLILQKRKSRLERDFLSILSKSIIYKLKGTKIYKDELGKILNGEKDPYTSAKEISDIIRKNIIDV
jgi:LAO/AO transport system kinase